ncbi:ABC transporter substrate-binding protein [Effusibacillus dendaii]|uniref:Ethanolamine utilization protein EutJ n=1 Tax=Effusibacillus dendaii TaxID=2743772 RepID=A0A7I8D9A6_9BACL|nr:ABC transporter substrate-binding protein [Effusibacillus dendaii]BCJ86587.1 ethanolamine utilization protein EutJ [Effusibacillus dendaii]
MKKKLLAVAAVMTMALGTLTACGSGKQAASNGGNNGDTIKVGANFELSGNVASFGNSALKGSQLAVQEINDAGGVLGKKIEIVQADNASKPEESARTAQKLISNDKVVALIGPTTSTNALAAVPVAMEKKIPMVTSTATNPKVTVDERTKKVNDWIFRACFIDPFQGKVMADFASKELKAKTAVIYTDQASDYAKGLSQFFEETFTKGGGQILEKDSYQANDTDFKAVLTRIKDKNPDVIYVPGYYNEVGKILKQAREMGIKATFLGGDGWDAPQLVDIAGKENLGNTYFSNHYAADDKSPEVQTFVQSYKAKYNQVPDGFAALGYDAMKLLADAIKRANSTDPEKLKTALAQTKDFKGATGTMSLNENHDPVKSAVVIKFEDGKQVFNSKINP